MAIGILALSVVFFLALVMNLALKPAYSARFTTIIMIIAVVGGLIYYGTGFAETTGSILISIIRTPLSVIRMFVGVNELSAISGATLVSTQAGVIVFWMLHLLAFYSMASAAFITIGAEAVRQLRFLLSRHGDLTLIFGVNEQSIQLGKQCRAAGKGSVVFVAENVSSSVSTSINEMGMSVMTGLSAVSSDKRFMRKLRVSSRRLTVYALDPSCDRNLYYALQLKDALEKAGVDPQNTRVTLPGAEEIITSMLQVSENAYGFGYVFVFDNSALTARAMISVCPPWDFVSFDEKGRAKDNFECVVVGFGDHGQAALKQLVMNGQFAGSTFKAAVFSKNFRNEAGYLMVDSPELFKQYDIAAYEKDARSKEFFEYIGNNLKTLKYIAICTGNDAMNSEISDNLMLYLQRRKAEHICVVQCGTNGARYQQAVGTPIINKNIFTLDMLSAEKADRAAIILNAFYDNSERSEWDKWVACDAFSKMSSRASTDFIPAMIKASGASEDEIAGGDWNPDKELLANLGETEHLRWIAFHYTMGYSAMSREEFDSNAKEYARCKAENIPCSIKIAKNSAARTHACLINWDELDELSERENAITGRGVDYKQLDINNVIAIPEILRRDRKAEASK